MLESSFFRPGRISRWGVLLFAIVAFISPAFARTYHITRFNDGIVVQENGRVVVSEEITFSFQGAYNGIYRNIPVEYPGDAGSNYTLFIENVDVTDGDGNALKFNQQYKGGELQLKVFIPGAVDTTRTVRIRYVVLNGIRYFEDHDASFPAAATGVLRAHAFEGVYGSADRSITDILGSNAQFQTSRSLTPRGGFTIDVYLPKAILSQPSIFTRGYWFLRSNLILVLPLLSFLVMGGMWYYKGRDPDSGLSVAPLYEPPEGMTPAEVGTLIDDSVDPRDITSTLIDLAVRGYLKIEEVNDKVLFFNNTDFVFHLLKPQSEWGTLARHENEILTNMFQSGSMECHFSDLKNRFYLAIPSIKKQII